MQPDGTTLLALRTTTGDAENSSRADRLPGVVIASALTVSAIRDYTAGRPMQAVLNEMTTLGLMHTELLIERYSFSGVEPGRTLEEALVEGGLL